MCNSLPGRRMHSRRTSHLSASSSSRCSSCCSLSMRVGSSRQSSTSKQHLAPAGQAPGTHRAARGHSSDLHVVSVCVLCAVDDDDDDDLSQCEGCRGRTRLVKLLQAHKPTHKTHWCPSQARALFDPPPFSPDKLSVSYRWVKRVQQCCRWRGVRDCAKERERECKTGLQVPP